MPVATHVGAQMTEWRFAAIRKSGFAVAVPGIDRPESHELAAGAAGMLARFS